MTGDVITTFSATTPSTHLELNGQAISDSGDTAGLHAIFGDNLPDATGRVLISTGEGDLGDSFPAKLKHVDTLGNQRTAGQGAHYLAGDNTGDKMFHDGTGQTTEEGHPAGLECRLLVEK